MQQGATEDAYQARARSLRLRAVYEANYVSMKPLGPTMGHWCPLQPRAVATLFANINTPWWIAGGWALDLFLGCQTRAHDDIDVGILRRDVVAVMANLPGWEFCEARSQALYLLEGNESPRPEVNSLWCRPCNAREWSFELMLDEADGATWVFRRLPTIRKPLSEVIRRTPDGIPYLSPEIQLLYKARLPREKDREDFERVLPRLAPVDHAWLRHQYDAIKATTAPSRCTNHPPWMW